MTQSKKAKPAPEATAPKSSKKDLVLDLLRRTGGASVAEIAEATGWLPHTARAMLTGFRKKGFALAKEKVEGATRYAISPAPAE